MPNAAKLATAADVALAVGETMTWTPSDHEHSRLGNFAARLTFILTTIAL